MSIEEPAHNSSFLGRTEGIHFHGRIDAMDPAPGQLWTRWYSSLPAVAGRPPELQVPVDLDKVAISPAGGALSFDRDLWIGSHAITFTVKDVAGDDKDALTDVRYAGMAGGAPAPGKPASGESVPAQPKPCVIHVLIAEPTRLPPLGSDGRTPITRAGGVWAEAPVAWPDPAYQAVNRLTYRWVFATPSNTPVAHLGPGDLSFAQRTEDHPPCVGVAPLPASVPAGQYELTLQVGLWDKDTAKFTRYDEKTVAITVTG
ncbi:hypothetical protein GCM10023317_49870 [Actinopolymorpha pittospori]